MPEYYNCPTASSAGTTAAVGELKVDWTAHIEAVFQSIGIYSEVLDGASVPQDAHSMLLRSLDLTK